MLMSGASSILTRGIIEEQMGIQLLWSQWLIAFLPVTLITILLSVPVTKWLFPSERGELSAVHDYFHSALSQIGPWSATEKKALVWFLVAVGLWSTDFVHHINPAVIGLGIGLFLTLPSIGVLEAKIIKQMNFLVIIFSAGALSMGTVLTETGTLGLLTGRLIPFVQPLFSDPVSYALGLYVTGFCYHLVLANRQSMLITSLPVLLQVASIHGCNAIALSFVWTFAGGAALFIHQSAIYVMGYSYGYFQAKDFMRVGLIMTVIEGALLVLLVQFYWPVIGLNWK
jgi:di/tricarboxylate transporter